MIAFIFHHDEFSDLQILLFVRFRPVALMSQPENTWKQIFRREIMTGIDKFLDPLQFSDWIRRIVNNSNLFMLNTLYEHLEKT